VLGFLVCVPASADMFKLFQWSRSF